MIQLFNIVVTIVLFMAVVLILNYLIRLMLRAFDNSVKREFKKNMTPEQYKLFEETYYGLEKALDDN